MRGGRCKAPSDRKRDLRSRAAPEHSGSVATCTHCSAAGSDPQCFPRFRACDELGRDYTQGHRLKEFLMKSSSLATGCALLALLAPSSWASIRLYVNASAPPGGDGFQ